MSGAIQSQSFAEFYLDPNITGHELLLPSIWVGKTVRDLFSTVEKSGLEAVSEVAQRIIILLGLLVALPLIVAYSAICIPIGLLIKWIYYEPQQRDGLRELETLLLTIQPGDKETIRKAKLLLITYGDNSAEAKRFARWLALISLHRIQGEIPVSRDGNCIFRAFLADCVLANSLVEDHAEERKRVVEWMRKNYQTDDKLKSCLVDSMSEHYLSKIKEAKDVDKKRQMQEKMVAIFNNPKDIVEGYFTEIAQDKSYAGPAEIYTLSKLHKVPVHVYLKKSKDDQKPHLFLTFNTHYGKKKPRCLIKYGEHYDAYVPPT